MGWTNPITWAPGLFSSSVANVHIRDNLNFLRDVLLGAQGLGAHWEIAGGWELRFSDTDVAHGMTGIAETDQFAILAPRTATGGGLHMYGLTDVDLSGIRIYAVNGSATGVNGGLTLSGAKKSGTGATEFAAGEAVIVFQNDDTNLMVLYQEGLRIIEGGLCVGFAGTPVADEVQVGDSTFKLDFVSASDVRLQFDTNDYILFDRTVSSYSFNVGAVEKMVISSGGIRLASGSVATLALSFVAEPTTGLFLDGGDLGLVSDGVELLRLRDDGDIQWKVAQTALGGGATATLGTIGGTGPGTAAQQSWLRFRDSSGTVKFIPCFV